MRASYSAQPYILSLWHYYAKSTNNLPSFWLCDFNNTPLFYLSYSPLTFIFSVLFRLGTFVDKSEYY
jgi:hypothetical protein